jgi:hypothetical protein
MILIPATAQENDNGLLKYDTPRTCFGLQWPSSGMWLSKERAGMGNLYWKCGDMSSCNYSFL